MRFVEQNKKKFDPRYFLKEDEDDVIKKAQKIKPATPEEIERQKLARQRAAQKTKEFMGADYVPLEDDEESQASGTLAPSQASLTPSEISSLGDKPISLSDIATSGKGIKCPAAITIQKALFPLIAPLVPEGPRKAKILARLQDGKVGPSTASIYNYIAKSFYGLEPVSINQQGFQKICNLNPQALNAVAYQAKKISKPMLKAYVDAAVAPIEKPMVGTGKPIPEEPKTSATEPQMQMPPGGLYQRTPKEASGRDQDEELQESKVRKTSYMKLNEQKHKRLFKALIEG